MTVPPCTSRWVLRWVLSWQSLSLLIAYFAIHHSGYLKHPLLSKSLILFFVTVSPHHSFSDLAFNESASSYCCWTLKCFADFYIHPLSRWIPTKCSFKIDDQIILWLFTVLWIKLLSVINLAPACISSLLSQPWSLHPTPPAILNLDFLLYTSSHLQPLAYICWLESLLSSD